MDTTVAATGTNDADGLIVSYLFTRQPARERHLNAPCLKQREAYLHQLIKFGRRKKQVADVAKSVIHVIRFTEFTGSNAVSEQDILRAADAWSSSDASRKTFKSVARTFFRFLGLYELGQTALWFDVYLSQFLVDFSRNRSSVAVRAKKYVLRLFLTSLCGRHSELSTITLSDVDDYVDEKRKAECRPHTIKRLCSDLRMFFHYAESRGWSDVGLSGSIRAPWSRSIRNAHKGPTWRQIRKRIAELDVTVPSHCRAKAIFLLAAIYGLRMCEIARLTLDDLDWHNEMMTVRRAKSGRIQQFPLQFEVGEAIIRYLLSVRPSCPYRNVFINMNTPYRPAVGHHLAVGPLLNASKIFEHPCGLHALRHACATELLRQGTSLRGIADILGHRDLQSVSIYAHCSVRMLRKVADFSLKGVL